MSEAPRRKLTLRPRGSLIDEADDGPLRLGMHDFTLPCRNFVVEHKVAEVGKVSITAEFLLRLLKAVGRCTEEEAAAFFGYNRPEMSYVLNEVQQADFVVRSEGRLSLTATGHALFRAGQDEPAIYEVERKTARVGFDLISLAPQERASLSLFEIKLPELPIQDPKRVAIATDLVPLSFRRFYGEIAPRTDPTTTVRRSLYSIDGVTAKERYSALVRVHVNSTGMRPTVGEIDLSDWRSEFERADRGAVATSAASMLEKLTISKRSDDPEAYGLLIELAPEYLKEYTRRDGLAVERFYRYAYASHGEVRSDRPTVPLVGSVFTLENARRLFEVVTYALRRKRRPPEAIFWIVPQLPLWGSTTVLPDILDHAVSRIDSVNQDLLAKQSVVTVALTATKPDRWVSTAFKLNYCAERRVFPSGFEMVLAPGIFTAALVHAPVGAQSGLAVPLGIVSFDENVVARATALLERVLMAYRPKDQLIRQLEQAVAEKGEKSLAGSE